jgi:hypothetical protein
MDYHFDKSHIGVWQRLYDCRRTLSDTDVLWDYRTNVKDKAVQVVTGEI